MIWTFRFTESTPEFPISTRMAEVSRSFHLVIECHQQLTIRRFGALCDLGMDIHYVIHGPPQESQTRPIGSFWSMAFGRKGIPELEEGEIYVAVLAAWDP